MATKKHKKKSSASSAQKSAPVVPAVGAALQVTLNASPDFYEATHLVESGISPAKESDSGLPQGGSVLEMDRWDRLETVVLWFGKGVQSDKSAQLKFSPLLTKEQRAVVHRLVEQKVPWLAEGCTSRGWGDDRFLVLHHPSMAHQLGKIVLTEDQEIKANALWRWATAAGIQCSRDEIKERVSANAYTPELVELWKSKSAEQRAVEALNAAVSTGDAAAARQVLSERPALLSDGVCALIDGRSPLHCAAAAGQVEMMRLLIVHGAQLEGLDGRGHTALAVARMQEQCDAEGVLLQAGAKDPKAGEWPGAAETPALASDNPEAPAQAIAPGPPAAPASAVDAPTAAPVADAAAAEPERVAAAAAADVAAADEPSQADHAPDGGDQAPADGGDTAVAPPASEAAAAASSEAPAAGDVDQGAAAPGPAADGESDTAASRGGDSEKAAADVAAAQDATAQPRAVDAPVDVPPPQETRKLELADDGDGAAGGVISSPGAGGREDAALADDEAGSGTDVLQAPVGTNGKAAGDASCSSSGKHRIVSTSEIEVAEPEPARKAASRPYDPLNRAPVRMEIVDDEGVEEDGEGGDLLAGLWKTAVDWVDEHKSMLITAGAVAVVVGSSLVLSRGSRQFWRR